MSLSDHLFRGGVLSGSVVDHLASQGSLALVVTSLPGAVRSAATVDSVGNLAVTEAGPSALRPVAAELCHSLARRTRGGPPGGTLAIAAITLAMVFSVWMAGATGAEAVQRGTVLILIGIPVYVVTRRTNPSGRSGALC